MRYLWACVRVSKHQEGEVGERESETDSKQ